MPKKPEGQAEVTGFDPEFESILDRESLDPDMHYRFIHERPQRVARMKAKGYRVVLASEDKVVPLLGGAVGADDSIRSGDTVLMCVPREKFTAGRKKLRQMNRARMSAPKQQFRSKTRGAAPGGKDVNVVTADRSDKE